LWSAIGSVRPYGEVSDQREAKFELYELGSQIRRSSNSIAANLAEGWNNKHINPNYA